MPVKKKPNLKNLVLGTYDARAEKIAAEEQFRSAQTRAVEAMISQKESGILVPIPEGDLQATVVAGEDLVVDWESLKDAIGDDAWERCQESAPSLKKLTALVESGHVSPLVLSKHTTVKPRSPFIKFTLKQRKGEA